MDKWVSGKIQLHELQKQAYEEEISTKRRINEERLHREKELTELLKEEIRTRIKCTLEKHVAEMEFISLQKQKLI
jgi:hypothetical protein